MCTSKDADSYWNAAFKYNLFLASFCYASLISHNGLQSAAALFKQIFIDTTIVSTDNMTV